jgi:glycosyltransferase involved in cell wall biosynthesis
VAKKYAEQFPDKCVFIQREKNGGLAATRNSALKAFSGDWVTFVDSDDWVDKEYVSALHSAAIKENADIAMCQFYYSYPSGALERVSPFGDLTTESSHKEKVAFSDSCSCTRFFRRRLFTDMGIDFPEDIWRSEDISTIIPLLTKTDKIALVEEPLYYYFQRSTSLSNQNYKGVDVTFFPKTIKRMLNLSSVGFERELEYRAINELMYGMVMVMLRSGKSRKELKEHIPSPLFY